MYFVTYNPSNVVMIEPWKTPVWSVENKYNSDPYLQYDYPDPVRVGPYSSPICI